LNFVHNQLELCPFTGQPRDPRADWVPIIFWPFHFWES
jgi:hypothetical protein